MASSMCTKISTIGPSVFTDHVYKLVSRSVSVQCSRGACSALSDRSCFKLPTGHHEFVPVQHCQRGLYICSKDVHTLSARKTRILRFSLPSPLQKLYSSSSRRPISERENGDDEDGPPVSDTGMNLRYHIENGYLSWMRNTYIATLVSVTIMHLEACGTPMTIGAVFLLIGALNVTAGTFGYLYGMTSLYRRRYVSQIMRIVCQIFAVIHFIAWYIVFTMLFPTLEVVDKELDAYEQSLK